MFTIKGDTISFCRPRPQGSCWTPCNDNSCGGPSEPVTIRFDETGEATAYTKTKVWKTNVVNITCSFGHDPSSGDMYPDSELMLGCVFPPGTLASILKRVYDYDYEPDLLGSTNVYTFKGLLQGLSHLVSSLKVVKKDKKVLFILREETSNNQKQQFIDHPRVYDETIKLLKEKSTYSGNYEVVSLPQGTYWHPWHVPIGTYDRLVKVIHNIGDEDHGVDLLGL